MIPFDFLYYRPSTLKEAFDCYQNLISENKAPLYYSGGTEIISMARVKSITFDAIIDIKDIPECNELRVYNNEFVIGSANTLTQIAKNNSFPLLSKTITRIADHTIQGKITIGGNLTGTIKYREAALPLMLSDCYVKVMTQKGIIEFPFMQIFDGRLNINPEEFLISISINTNDLNYPYCHVKKTKMDKIDYPLITMAATKSHSIIKSAITGYGNKPLLLPVDMLNNKSCEVEKRIKKIIKMIRDECEGDLSGSSEYREFVLHNILEQMYKDLK